MEERYPVEELEPEYDDGTMVRNVEHLQENIVGRRIVKVEEKAKVPGGYYGPSAGNGLKLTLDDGRQVCLVDTSDCCAYTELTEVIKHLDSIDHVILGVGTTEGATKWHIYADLGDILELQVAWSSGNPFYYGYGFNIIVIEPSKHAASYTDSADST